jgi:transcriptional regulator with XRE-family HTH domain
VRLRLGLTQVEMAKRLGVGLNTLKRYEQARRLRPLVALAVETLRRGLA